MDGRDGAMDGLRPRPARWYEGSSRIPTSSDLTWTGAAASQLPCPRVLLVRCSLLAGAFGLLWGSRVVSVSRDVRASFNLAQRLVEIGFC